jgi:hypothetical protein
MYYATAVVTLAVAVTTTTSVVNSAWGQSAPPMAVADNGLPADIAPGSPLADVVKMLRAGVDASTIEGFIQNCQSQFNLNADNISYLRDIGASSDVIDAMLNRDKALIAATGAAAPTPASAPISVPASSPLAIAAPESAPAAIAAPEPVAPPATAVTVDYFNTTLSPYGSWVEVEGYGRCWRPTVAIYNARWNPYGDNGHWVYTDYGWYWDSDYGWGTTFHYGRWFRNPRFGWCWYPDTVWAPSWVVWRSADDYCGWAPLPPFAVYTPGVGFYYRGAAVAVDFDFGLTADCFLFVGPDHFCDRHPRSFFVPHERVVEVFHHTTIINNFSVHDHVVGNHGFGPERIAAASHHPVEPVHLSSLPNAGRQGYRGEGFQNTMHPAGAHPVGGAQPGHPGGVLPAGHPGAAPVVNHAGTTPGREATTGANNQVRNVGGSGAATTAHPGTTVQQPTIHTPTTAPGQIQNRGGNTGGAAVSGAQAQPRPSASPANNVSQPQTRAPNPPVQGSAPAPAHPQAQPQAQPEAQPQAQPNRSQGNNNGGNKNNQNNKQGQ